MSANRKRTVKKRNTNNKKQLLIGSVIIAAILVVFSLLLANSGDNNAKSEIKTFESSKSSTIESNADDSSNQIKEATSSEITILKSEITETAKFYPYQSEDTYMEVIAIRASDGTVRTAFNTCQVCLGSGRAYYKQDGDVLVCQNCGNRFTVDQVEVVKGGCNPIPIFSENKIESTDVITIESDFLDANKELFYNWKS